MATPQQYCTGANLIYAGLGSANTPLFLGTCEQKPDWQEVVEYDEAFNDLAGTKLPMDYLYEGEIHLITCRFTFLNQTAMNVLNKRPFPLTSTIGQQGILETGSLMGLENAAFPLWMLFSFRPSQKAAMVQMEEGRKYLQVIPYKNQATETGTGLAVYVRRFLAFRKFDVTNKIHKLWTDDVSAVANLGLA